MVREEELGHVALQTEDNGMAREAQAYQDKQFVPPDYLLAPLLTPVTLLEVLGRYKR